MTSNMPIVDFTALSFNKAVDVIIDVTHTRVNDPRTEHRVWIRIRSAHGVMAAVKWMTSHVPGDNPDWWAIAS
jgi:hypothetical protein